MQVVLSERVKIALSTLSPDAREKVTTWFRYLENWEDDAFVKSQSVQLNVQGRSEYMFRTTTDLRIFYTVDPESKIVHVVDFATRDTILAFGGVSTGGS